MSAVKSFHRMIGVGGGASGGGASGGGASGGISRLDEVLLLFLRVHVVPLGVDDGRVSVGGVLRPFGLVR